MKSGKSNCIYFFSPLLIVACVGIILGATVTDWPLADELFLGSVIVTGVTLACMGVVLQLCSSVTKNEFDNPKLDGILEAMQMSENAKRILFRDRELLLIRKTVQDDIAKNDFHAALVLCDQMANVFGAVEEAEQMRTRVQEIIHQHHENRIQEEMLQLASLLEEQKWVDAYQFSARMRRLYPESPLLHGLEQKIADARTQYRHHLEDRFLNAAQNEDVENAMLLLRELDGYLTPEEARKFRDTATSVITTYRETLSARFKMAVSDHRWNDAIEFGEEIIRQFPNTKMAEEVSEMIKTIRTRSIEDETDS